MPLKLYFSTAMSSFKNTYSFFRFPIYKHLLFWIGVLSYFIITSNISFYSGYMQIIDFTLIFVLCQIITAYVCLDFLIPKFLIPKKHLKFGLAFLLLLIVVFFLFACLHEYYYHPKYNTFFNSTPKYSNNKGAWDTLLNLPAFISKTTKFLTPTALLVIAQFYKNQQAYLKLSEQKKSNELAVLKHQLNPHFLFNTLNNLYALAIKKSDQTPDVIAKLSEILDYMLYGCNDKYVSIQKEIELIDNYLALEKIRYGKRVNIEFIKKIDAPVNIAPLILLTFIENAFKHGVSQELKEASIQIEILLEHNYIDVRIKNSIAQNRVASKKQSIGIINVKKQLALLYEDTYSLIIKEETHNFSVHLKLPVK